MLIIVMIIGMLCLLFAYQYFFKINVKKALLNHTSLKLPDLNDVLITYIILCILILFSVKMNQAETYFKEEVEACVSDEVTIEVLSSDYGYCINQYGNIIFNDQETAMNQIFIDYKDLIEELEAEPHSITLNYYDSLYYKLDTRRFTKEREELYLLLSIYRNHFETKYIDLKIKGAD